MSRREQQEILDKYRDWLVQEEWWESEYDFFKERMREVGIDVVQMYFRGFWAQGDGASFEGHTSELALFIREHDIQAPTILSLLAEDIFDGCFTSRVRGRYVHSGCMSFEHECVFPGPDYNDLLLDAAADVRNRLAEEEWIELTLNRAPDIFRDYANDLYRSLEEEYEYLTSDEQVLELLISNELLEEELEPYESDCTEEGDESTDSDAL